MSYLAGDKVTATGKTKAGKRVRLYGVVVAGDERNNGLHPLVWWQRGLKRTEPVPPELLSFDYGRR